MDLHSTIPMTPISSDRASQLKFFQDSCQILQDKQLIDLIQDHDVDRALGFGDVGYFRDFVQFVDDGPVDFCVYIINQEFDLDQICDHVNRIIATKMRSPGLVYLSINKYLVKPRCHNQNLPGNYDEALLMYVSSKIRASLKQYFACGQDQGLQFNWIHPLTRFVFST